MATWSQAPTGVKAPPYTQDVTVLRDYIKTLADIVAIISKDVSFILNGNVDGKNIKANSIEARNIHAEAITAEKIAVNAVTADKIDVDELSAIAGNLGTITAGLMLAVTIIGSYVATSTIYPRSEMDVNGAFLGAFNTADNYLKIDPFHGNVLIEMKTLLNTCTIQINEVFADELLIGSSNDIRFSLGASGVVTFPSWSKVFSAGDGQTLKQALDNLSNRITALGG